MDYALFSLFLVFLILKLTGAIGWSWWWVTSPIWIPIAAIVATFGLLCLFGIMIGIVYLFECIFDLL